MKPGILLALSLLLYAVAAYFRSYADVKNPTIVWLATFGVTLFEYLLGSIAYKARFFTKLSKIDDKLNASKPLTVLKYAAFLLLYVVMLLFHSLVFGSIAIAPFTGAVIIVLFHFTKKPAVIERFFLFIGKHSTNIWLTHMFFYAVLFKDFIFIAKYPVLIFAFMLVVTVALSVVLNRILSLKRFLPCLNVTQF